MTGLEQIEIIVLDVDGVLTDGTVYYSEKGEELKRFSIRDGMGLDLWQKAGFTCAIVTREKTGFPSARARKLKIEHCITGATEKASTVRELLAKLGIPKEHAAFVGDDVNDAAAFDSVGLKVAVGDAHPALKELADQVLTEPGGRGAVRELVEMLFAAKSIDPVALIREHDERLSKNEEKA